VSGKHLFRVRQFGESQIVANTVFWADKHPSVGWAVRHREGARIEQKYRRRALKRAEVAFVKKRREEWWECPNRLCGAQILFLMIGPAPDRVGPTCFCGSTMQRVARTRRRRYGSREARRPDTNDARECKCDSTEQLAGKATDKAAGNAARSAAEAMPG
jgi:hypothetical protein